MKHKVSDLLVFWSSAGHAGRLTGDYPYEPGLATE
jgi:hypothetical protein